MTRGTTDTDTIKVQALHEVALRSAEQVLLREREAGREPDPSIWKGIEVLRRWVKGEATDEELAAAREAEKEVYQRVFGELRIKKG
jgi:hypothetical protein